MRSMRQTLAVTLAVGLLTTPVFAQDTATTPDLLPGVDLVTEDVEPGVYRVIGDGVRILSIPVSLTRGDLDHGRFREASKIVVAPDEGVWVFGPQEFFRVGEGTAHAGKPWSMVDVDANGTVWALLEPGGDDYDGYGDYRHKDLLTFDGEQWLRKARKVVDFELHPDGETFIVIDSNDGSIGPGLHASIGPVHDAAWEDVGVVEPWKWGGMTIGEGYGGFAISPRATSRAPYPGYTGWAVDGRGLLSDIQFDASGDGGGAGCCSTVGSVVGLGYGSDGTSWVQLRFDLPVMTDAELTTESAYFLARYDASNQGSPRATYESEPISYPDHGLLDGEIAEHLDVAPDGSVWLPSDDGLARFDGRTWMWFLRGNIIEDVDIAADGTVWVQANDLEIGPQSPPASDQDPTTKTYVITPEAVAAAE